MSGQTDASTSLVAVAGASGFVGTHIRQYFSGTYRFRALSRSTSIVEQHAGEDSTEWRKCDLYSLPKVTEALEGCSIGIYLVHSMAPSSRLMQGSFENTDLLLADNFARAAEAAGLSHVVYLSGLMPESDEALSPHLRSRLEVEEVLRSRSVPVTVLRAGLIFGPGGSSFSLLINLVRRLPFMLLPAWAKSKTHSIDIDNVCHAVEQSLSDVSLMGGSYDLGGHELMTYRDMILRTSQLLGKPEHYIDFPYNCFSLSKHWVAFFGKVEPALAGPLLESLKYDLAARPNALLASIEHKLVCFDDSFAKSVDERGNPRPNPRSETQKSDRKRIKHARRVRSVQRMPYPDGWNANEISQEYGRWLSRRFRGVIRAETNEDGVVSFMAFAGCFCLLKLSPTPYSVGNLRRCAYYISGGLLSRTVDPPGRLEFRLFPELKCLIASIHGFAPTLPWWLYANTQARIHLYVMKAFSKHLLHLEARSESV